MFYLKLKRESQLERGSFFVVYTKLKTAFNAILFMIDYYCRMVIMKYRQNMYGGTLMKKRLIFLLIIPFLFFTHEATAEEKYGIQEDIIYNILVDRFNVGDHVFDEQVRVSDPYAYQGGDFQGIIKKLDSLQELGFTMISLSPIMSNAPDGYHGYWIEDFYNVEEQFGSMDDFNQLIEEAHKREIKVVMEFVTNYVAQSHSMVNDPDKLDWFIESKIKSTPSTKWLDNVAVFNHDNVEVEEFLVDVAKFWMEETDIDGFKLHHADLISEPFLTNFTESISQINSDFYILANTSNTGNSIDHIRNNPYIHAVENEVIFEKLNEVFTEEDKPVSILFDTWKESDESLDLLFVDNENTSRFSNNFSEKGRNALTTWKLALTYMYTTPGVPSLYQGSELPMYGPGFPENQQLVQFNSTDPDLEEFIHRISSLRSEFPVFSYGSFEHVDESEAMSLFKRSYKDETMYIAINNATELQTVHIANNDSKVQLRGLLGDDIVRENQQGEFKISVPRETAEIYIVEEDRGLNWLFIGAVSGVLLLFVIAVIYLSRKQATRS